MCVKPLRNHYSCTHSSISHRDRNGTVLVNRGWVPRSWEAEARAIQEGAAAAAPAAPAAKGRGKPAAAVAPKPLVTVLGVVQPSERPSAVVPDNRPDVLEFHWVDVPTLVRRGGRGRF